MNLSLVYIKRQSMLGLAVRGDLGNFNSDLKTLKTCKICKPVRKFDCIILIMRPIYTKHLAIQTSRHLKSKAIQQLGVEFNKLGIEFNNLG